MYGKTWSALSNGLRSMFLLDLLFIFLLHHSLNTASVQAWNRHNCGCVMVHTTSLMVSLGVWVLKVCFVINIR